MRDIFRVTNLRGMFPALDSVTASTDLQTIHSASPAMPCISGIDLSPITISRLEPGGA